MAKVTIGFHRPGHKWFLAPDFTAIALGDDVQISEAMEFVLRAKRKSLQPAEKEHLVAEICRHVNDDTVAGLRRLDENGWKEMNVPLLCRVYLRHLVEQSVVLNRQQLLECDFNSGLGFNMQTHQAKLAQIMQLGFSREDAFEALIVTGNQQIDMAAQFLLTDAESRRMEYEKQRKRTGKAVPPNRHYTIIERAKKEKEQMQAWVKKSTGELELELTRMKRNLAAERNKTENLVKRRDELAKANQLELYQSFIRGIISDPSINAAEAQRIEQYRDRRNLTNEDHVSALTKLNLTEKIFDEMKSFEDVATNKDECLVCYEPPKDHMLLPCHHVCLCGDCAAEYKTYGDEAKCPLCDEKIKEMKQVYYF